MNFSTEFTIEEDVQRLKNEIFALQKSRVLLVEGKNDKSFWGSLFEEIVPNQCKIYASVHFPTHSSSGKNTLQTHYLSFAAADFLLCFDSDYDYLLGNPIFQRPFVFQTFVHSVENYRCFAPSLNAILQKSTQNSTVSVDFDRFFQAYSGYIFNNFVQNLFENRVGDYYFNPLLRLIFEHIKDDSILDTWWNFVEEVTPKITLSDELLNFANHLETIGLTSKNTYLFIRGHDLLDKIVLIFLKNVANPIIEKAFSNKNSAEKADYQIYLKNNSFKKLLAENEGFKDCEFYLKLKKHIEDSLIVTIQDSCIILKESAKHSF